MGGDRTVAESVKVVYVGAGHTSTGGARACGLVEGRENIQVVDDCLQFLRAAGHLAPGGMRFSNGVRLVVVPHDLDLADSIRFVNDSYLALGFRHWQDGVCIEAHFNAMPGGAQAQGPMVVHTEGAASRTLAGLAAGALEGVLGLPCRHWTNEQNLASRGFTYGWIRDTLPLALIIEMDELDNPERAQVIGDDALDDVYGRALAAVVLAVAGNPSPFAPPEPPPDPWESLREWQDAIDSRLERLERQVFGP